MAHVRIPESAVILLPYCKAHIHKNKDPFFPTYAHMMIFAASIGFKRDEYDRDISFITRDPYPITFDIFKNLNLFDIILCLALSEHKTYKVLDDEDLLAKVIEGYSSAGFRQMLRLYERCGGHNYLDEWIQDIIKIE